MKKKEGCDKICAVKDISMYEIKSSMILQPRSAASIELLEKMLP